MRKNVLFTLVLATLSTPTALHASQQGQNLGICLSDSLNGKERKYLARWIYFGMSTHSTIKPYANVSRQDMEESDKYVGGLVTRLLTEDCPKAARAALDKEGLLAFEHAFSIVGQVAMQELMNEPNVSQALGAFEQHLDQEKFDEAFD